MRAAGCFLVLALLLSGREGSADDSNFRPYLIGARAAGMGGAFTALADDGSGPYYNPGGLAFARASSLSLTASLYGLVMGSQKDAVGDGHDFQYLDVNTFPVATASVFKWGQPTTPDGAPPNSLGINVFVPDGLIIDDRDAIASNENALFLSQQTQTVWAGLTYARRVGRLGLGASGYVLMASGRTFLDLTAAAAADRFATISARTDLSTVGLLGAVGARLDVTDHWRLGLAVFTPEVGVYNKRRTFQRITIADATQGQAPQIIVINIDDLHAAPTMPLRVQAGVAWTAGALTVAADAMLLAPIEIRDDVDRPGLDRWVKRNAVVNGSVGAELVVRRAFPIRAGFFTDFAASPTPRGYGPTEDNPNPENSDHVNRFGGSLSIGYKTEHTQTDLGFVTSYGLGQAIVTHNLDFSDFRVSDMTHTLLYFVLAAAYEF
jgi:long-chain fatty acid transport protein